MTCRRKGPTTNRLVNSNALHWRDGVALKLGREEREWEKGIEIEWAPTGQKIIEWKPIWDQSEGIQFQGNQLFWHFDYYFFNTVWPKKTVGKEQTRAPCIFIQFGRRLPRFQPHFEIDIAIFAANVNFALNWICQTTFPRVPFRPGAHLIVPDWKPPVEALWICSAVFICVPFVLCVYEFR